MQTNFPNDRSINPTWASPPAVITLPANEVHVWKASLERPASLVARLRQLLTEDELARADRFHFDKDRNHFTVGRGLLRLLLSQYLDLRPGSVQFDYGHQGKPSLKDSDIEQKHRLQFNLSHSKNIVLYAVTLQRELGVDVEYHRELKDLESMARFSFSPQENAMLRQVPATLQLKAFYNCWTRKEAYIKALGDGLAHPLHQFDVSLIPGEPAQLLRAERSETEKSRWLLKEIYPEKGYTAALCVEGHDWQLKLWDFDDTEVDSAYEK